MKKKLPIEEGGRHDDWVGFVWGYAYGSGARVRHTIGVLGLRHPVVVPFPILYTWFIWKSLQVERKKHTWGS